MSTAKPIVEPILDNRNFQDIVDELKKRIPLYCPEWTDHNVHDPGVTLIELFAYMTSQTLYQMSQLPLLNYVKFAQFLGIPVPTAQPACASVTFWLSKPWRDADDPANSGLLIDSQTKVTTTQTETRQPIIFETEQVEYIFTPKLSSVVSHQRSSKPADSLSPNAKQKIFSNPPIVGDTLEFTFDNDLSEHVLCLHLDFDEAAANNINTDDPPVVWECWTPERKWEKISYQNVIDGTKGFNTKGVVELHLPKLLTVAPDDDRQQSKITSNNIYKVRIRVTRDEYQRSPELLNKNDIDVFVRGRAIDTVHSRLIKNEYLGESDGTPGQRFALSQQPVVLPLQEDSLEVLIELPADSTPNQHFTENILLLNGNGLQQKDDSFWRYVENFEWSQPSPKNEADTMNKRLFSIDPTTNEVCLPPAIEMPDGQIVQYGAVPARGTKFRIPRYRVGGTIANVPAKAINRLKSSIPYIDSVENRYSATGGQNAVHFDALQILTQQYLQQYQARTQQSAITVNDYRTLILSRFPGIVGRVECQANPDDSGTIKVLIVPTVSDTEIHERLSLPEMSSSTESKLKDIDEYIYQYKLLGTRVQVREPKYAPLSITVTLAGTRGRGVEEKVDKAIFDFLHPVTGGWDKQGLPVGVELNEEQLKDWLVNQISTLNSKTIKSISVEADSKDTESSNTRDEVKENKSDWLFVYGRTTVNFA